MDKIENLSCINCQTVSEGNYCHHCGQKLHLPRLGFKQFVSDVMDRVLGLEGMLPRTWKGLFVHPGKVVSEYVNGNRKKYVNPVSYFFLQFGIYLLLISALNIDIIEMVKATGVQDSMQEAMGNPEISEESLKMQEKLQTAIFRHIQFFALLQFPFVAWFAMLFFKKKHYNFLEHIILPFYVFGHGVLFSIIYATIFKVTGFYSSTLSLLTTILYFCWAAYQFYQPQNKILGLIKIILVYTLSFICFVIMGGILGIVYAIIVN